MKKILLLAGAGLFLMLNGALADSSTKPAAITVVGVQGEARYSIDGQTWHPLVVGKILHAGAVIETAANSRADLVFSGSPVAIPETTSAPQSMFGLSTAPDPNVRGFEAFKPLAQQNVVRMTSDTMLAVDTLTSINTGADTIGDTELNLRAGKIFTSVKKMSADSKYIIVLPNGMAGIRGSAGSIAADGSVEWATGTIVLSIGDPHVFVIHGGQGYNASTGQVLPLSVQAIANLNAFLNFAQTLFFQFTFLAHNPGQTFISPTTSGVNPFTGP